MTGFLRVVCVSVAGSCLALACSSAGDVGNTHGASDPNGNESVLDGGGAASDGAPFGDGMAFGGDGAPSDGAGPQQVDAAQVKCSPPALPSSARGLAWTRSQPIFVSGLAVGLPAPTTAEVNDYFDAFGANAVHTWATGLPTRIAGFRAANHAGFRYVSWVDTNGTSLDNGLLLGGVGKNSGGRIGFQLGDEPVDEATLDTMLQSATNIRAVDPDALLIVNFADRANNDLLMGKAAAHADVDVLSVDRYAYKDEAYGVMAQVRSHALAANKPYWRYTDSYGSGSDASPSESDLRWDAMVGLVYGFTGLTWFVYQVDVSDMWSELYTANGSYSAAKSPRYASVATINHEVQNLGRALTQLTSTDVRYVPGTPLLKPKNTTTWSKGAGGHPYLTALGTDGAFHDIHAGFFVDGCGEHYVMLMNPAHTQGKFPLSGEETSTAKLAFDFSASTDATLDPTQIETLDPTDGLVKARSLTSTGPHTASLDIPLTPGQVVLFKQRDGHAFALR